FLADASHELRTPVTALLGNVEFLARHGAGDEVIGDLQRDAVRLARLVDNLLVLERAGDVALASATVELDTLLRELVSNHRSDGRVRVGQLDRVTVAGDREE